MTEVTAAEKLERAEKSLLLSRERLQAINRKLPELNAAVENLIVVSETERSKSSAIKKAQAELQSLEKEKRVLEQTISALQKALPTMEKAFRLEQAENETGKEYHEALQNLQEYISSTPGLNPFREQVEKLQSFADRLAEAQGRFFDVSQRLNETLIQENVESIAGFTIQSLQDNAALHYEPILTFSDELITLSERLNEIQYQLFSIGTKILPVTERPLLPVQETCKCGLHKRIFDVQERQWYFWEFQRDNMVFNEQGWKLIYRDSSKPPFPCEQPVKPVVKPKAKMEEKAKSQPVGIVFGNKDDNLASTPFPG